MRQQKCSRAWVNVQFDLTMQARFGPAISKYHRSKVAEIVTFQPGATYELGDFKLEATPTQHSEPTTFGLKLHSKSGIVGYTNDTQYFDGLAEHFKGVRVLIANVTRPLGMRIRWHLCSDDFISLLKQVKPELAVMVHMGMLFLRHKPEEEAAKIRAETGVETLPGYAGLRVGIDEKVKVKRSVKQPSLEAFAKPSPERFVGAE